MSKTIEMPWVEKYRPKSLKDMALPTAKVRGQRVKLTEELTKFVKDFLKKSVFPGKSSPKMIILNVFVI